MSTEHKTFEELKQYDSSDTEYWSARDLSLVLDYKDWRNFQKVVTKAILACQTSGHDPAGHFGDATKMVMLPSLFFLQGKLICDTSSSVKSFQDLSGTMIEDLLTPKKSIQTLTSDAKKLAKQKNKKR